MAVFEPPALRDAEVFAAPRDVCAALGAARFAAAPPFAPRGRDAAAFLDAVPDELREDLPFLGEAPLAFRPVRLFDGVVRGDLAMAGPQACCCRC